MTREQCKACVNAGWHGILDRLFEKLGDDGVAAIGQVKEKFGGLRVYFKASTDASAQAAVDEAELEAERTCEFCGRVGKAATTKYGWVKTMCEECTK